MSKQNIIKILNNSNNESYFQTIFRQNTIFIFRGSTQSIFGSMSEKTSQNEIHFNMIKVAFLKY